MAGDRMALVGWETPTIAAWGKFLALSSLKNWTFLLQDNTGSDPEIT
jgi:hypothetical protein